MRASSSLVRLGAPALKQPYLVPVHAEDHVSVRRQRLGLSRDVYGILGIPIDLDTIADVVEKIRTASAESRRALISTPNLNFLVSSLSDVELRQSLLMSDLCPIDGTPIVWIAKLLGIPFSQRVAGSDIFDALKAANASRQPIKVFLFGGAPGVAESALRSLNAAPSGLTCVGALYPGYCSIEEMSTPEVIDRINSSDADFLVVSLGAQKGQAWLLRNHARLKIPVRAHLGAAINFQGGTVKRAPVFFRKYGIEWLWRIKEEPHLWRRYWNDGRVFLALLVSRVLPLAFLNRYHRLRSRAAPFKIEMSIQSGSGTLVKLSGAAIADNVEPAIVELNCALDRNADVVIDVSGVTFIDTRFFGLFLALRKQLSERGLKLCFTGASRRTKRLFWLNAFQFLLENQAEPSAGPD